MEGIKGFTLGAVRCSFVLGAALVSRGCWNECYGGETEVTSGATYVMGVPVDVISVGINVMTAVMKAVAPKRRDSGRLHKCCIHSESNCMILLFYNPTTSIPCADEYQDTCRIKLIYFFFF